MAAVIEYVPPPQVFNYAQPSIQQYPSATSLAVAGVPAARYIQPSATTLTRALPSTSIRAAPAPVLNAVSPEALVQVVDAKRSASFMDQPQLGGSMQLPQASSFASLPLPASRAAAMNQAVAQPSILPTTGVGAPMVAGQAGSQQPISAMAAPPASVVDSSGFGALPLPAAKAGLSGATSQFVPPQPGDDGGLQSLLTGPLAGQNVQVEYKAAPSMAEMDYMPLSAAPVIEFVKPPLEFIKEGLVKENPAEFRGTLWTPKGARVSQYLNSGYGSLGTNTTYATENDFGEVRDAQYDGILQTASSAQNPGLAAGELNPASGVTGTASVPTIETGAVMTATTMGKAKKQKSKSKMACC